MIVESAPFEDHSLFLRTKLQSPRNDFSSLTTSTTTKNTSFANFYPNSSKNSTIPLHSRFYLMNLGLQKLNKAMASNNIHSSSRHLSDQVEVIQSYNRAVYELQQHRDYIKSTSSPTLTPSSSEESNTGETTNSALLEMAKNNQYVPIYPPIYLFVWPFIQPTSFLILSLLC